MKDVEMASDRKTLAQEEYTVMNAARSGMYSE
jgi:hypothetical protein